MLRNLLVCVAGIYICFLTWGYTQERVSTIEYAGKKFKYFIFLNAVQALVAYFVALIYQRIRGVHANPPTREVIFQYLKVSVLSCLASPFGYASLKHIDYPTLILGKSCKLLPVMFMNFVIYRKTFPLKKYFIVALITAGVSLFMLLQPKEGKQVNSASLYGLALLSINLILDGAYNSSQDQIFSKFKVQGTSMMVWMNIFSFGLMSMYLIVAPNSTELGDAILFCTNHPSILLDILLFAFAGAIGQCFIFWTLESFGSLTLVTITVTRKMFSILLSVFGFGHHLSLGQWAAVGLVFTAIGLEAADKAKAPKLKKIE